MISANTRYIVPMSLWLVANSQRPMPLGFVVVMVVSVRVSVCHVQETPAIGSERRGGRPAGAASS